MHACCTVLVPADAACDEMSTVVVSPQSCEVDTSGFRTGKFKENIYKWVRFNQNYAVWNISLCGLPCKPSYCYYGVSESVLNSWEATGFCCGAGETQGFYWD